MQWNCPHCGVLLAASEGTLGTGWSFSKCYKCGGFALIRRAEINIIKVDKAPPGEKVILPEAAENPAQGMMNEAATKKYALHTSGKSLYTPPPHPQSYSQSHSKQQQQQAPIETVDISTATLPEPLPSHDTPRPKKLNIGIGIATTLAILSGSYLYMEAQALWEKTHSQSKQASSDMKNETETEPATEKQEAQADIPAPALMAVAPKPTVAVITDQVQQSAMAPVRPTTSLESTVPVPVQKLIQPSTSVPVSISVPATTTATAPIPSTFPKAAMMVGVRAMNTRIHSGPSMRFPVIATAHRGERYKVIEWKDTWFKLQKQNPTLVQQSAKSINSSMSGSIGWVRNDLIEFR